jgi:hypothetical protein
MAAGTKKKSSIKERGPLVESTETRGALTLRSHDVTLLPVGYATFPHFVFPISVGLRSIHPPLFAINTITFLLLYHINNFFYYYLNKKIHYNIKFLHFFIL